MKWKLLLAIGLYILLAFLVLLPHSTSAADGNLVVNGNFESPPNVPLNPGWIRYPSGANFGGWTVSSIGPVDLHSGQYDTHWTNLPDGMQALDVNGNVPGGIYQDLATYSGSTYRLRFYMSSNPVCDPPSVQLQVLFGGAVVDQPTFNTSGHSLTDMRWELHEYLVAAVSNLSRLEFISLTSGTDCGPAIDAVEIIHERLGVYPFKQDDPEWADREYDDARLQELDCGIIYA